jgi:hypothetical protein
MRSVMTRIGFSETAAQTLVEEQRMNEVEEIRLLSGLYTLFALNAKFDSISYTVMLTFVYSTMV